MRRTILLCSLLPLLILIIGCSNRTPPPDQVIKSDPGNPDSPIVVADTSSGTVQGMGHTKAAPTTYSGHVQHSNYLLVGRNIYIQDSGGFLAEYRTPKVTIASSTGNDSNGHRLQPTSVDLTQQNNWTLLINGAYKLYSADRKTVVIDTTNMTPPFGLTYMTPTGYPPYWDLPTLNAAFSTVVLSNFARDVLYDSGQVAAHPAPGQWVITFDYCKGGVCQ